MLPTLLLALTLAGDAESAPPPVSAIPPIPPVPAIPWTAETVEHLYNRAGFGARPDEIARGRELGPEALVEELLASDEPWRRASPELFRWEDFGFTHRQLPLAGAAFNRLSGEEQVCKCKDSRLVDRAQFLELEGEWLASCIEHRAPVRDRMTLFWHSLFTTSALLNKRKFEVIRQFEWLRGAALSSYAELLHGIVRDPAMLQYYDNTGNYAEHPNENFARELMELYSLGEGHYTEVDVREAARALTGYAGGADGRFEFLADRHDRGEKTILGRTGDFDGDELVDILLEQPACSRYVARRLLRFFEGVEPAHERVEAYAAILRDEAWRILPFLRRLFLDPDFYRPEILGARVASPIELYVATCRKLEYAAPVAFAHEATYSMGQGLYAPPSVKGWPEGLGWVSSDVLLRRGNCVALLVGQVEARVPLEPGAAMEELPAPTLDMEERSSTGRRLEYARLADHIRGRAWSPNERWLPRARELGLAADAELVAWLVDAWLAIEPPRELAGELLEVVAAERAELGLAEGALVDHPQAFERVLRVLARIVFSLPEAQLS